MSAGAQAGSFLPVMLATGVAQIQRTRAYAIEIIRWPLLPIIYFITLLLTYRVSGQETAGGYNIEGFLLVGAIGMVLWTATIWSGGYTIEFERTEGTINSMFVTPSSRAGVVLGYSLCGLVCFIVPSSVVITLLAVLAGATFDVQSPFAVLLSLLSLFFGALALGLLLSGGFVLTRRANLWANFLQTPIILLSGMAVPVSQLPGEVAWFAEIFPISAGMDALRRSLLTGATTGDLLEPLTRFAISSVVVLIAGVLLLRRVENVAKRGGKFDLD